jgi:hypothetical protein
MARVPTDAIALLKVDHRAVNQLFMKFVATGERALKTLLTTPLVGWDRAV